MSLIKYIKNNFNNKILKKIVNVYQLQYTNSKAPGLGDFLRGCFCLMQLTVILNLEFDIDFKNHPMSQYIRPFIKSNTEKSSQLSFENMCDNNESTTINYENIHFFQNNNFNLVTSNENFIKEIINYLNNINETTHYMMCNSYPIFENISPIGKNLIKSKILPNELMQNNIILRFKKHNLSFKNYGVIHIRCGDEYLIDKKTKMHNSFTDIISNTLKLNLNPNKKYFICSDNNDVKLIIKNNFSNCIYQLNEINHLGESSIKTDNGIMFTLLDFYTIGYSNEVISFSKYSHGTGFSQWCSTIFNVPIKKIILS